MITNFEELTKELSEEELELLETLKTILTQTDKENPIFAPDIVDALHPLNNKFTQVRLRKLVNYIRTNRLMPLIATSKGYYVSYDETEIEREIKSLRERANSINNAADGLESFLVYQPELKFEK